MKSIDKKISRRGLIKGLGAMGILSSLSAETLLAQSGATPVRVLFIPLQHGWGISGTSNQFMSGSGSSFTFPSGLAPLNAIKDKCTVIDSLLTLGLWGNNHDLSYADVLTAGVPMGEESSSYDSHMPLSVTPSLDYLLQQKSGKPTFRFSAGYRSWGVEHHPLSFDNNASVLPYYTSANDAYQSLFAKLGSAMQPQVGAGNPAEARLVDNIFNFIRNPAERDLAALSSDEKGKLTRYLSAVDEAQLKVKPVDSFSGGGLMPTGIPSAKQSRFDDLTHYLEMIKVGFANNMTTSAVLGIGDIHEIDKLHHEHAHGRTPIWWKTRTEFAQTIAAFVQDLDKIVDFDGNTLLDNTIIVLTGEVGDGGHDVISKGNIIIGGGGGKLPMGSFLKQSLVSGADNIKGLMREDINGRLQPQITFGNHKAMQAGSRTNADLLREIGNMAGLNLPQFGLASQNKGDLLTA